MMQPLRYTQTTICHHYSARRRVSIKLDNNTESVHLVVLILWDYNKWQFPLPLILWISFLTFLTNCCVKRTMVQSCSQEGKFTLFRNRVMASVQFYSISTGARIILASSSASSTLSSSSCSPSDIAATSLSALSFALFRGQFIFHVSFFIYQQSTSRLDCTFLFVSYFC